MVDGTFCILIDKGKSWERIDGTWGRLDTAESVALAFTVAYRAEHFRVFNVLHPCAQNAIRA